MAGKRRKVAPPRWVVSCVGLPGLSLSARQASSAQDASERYVKEHGAKLRAQGGIVCVQDCSTGREERFRVLPRGARYG